MFNDKLFLENSILEALDTNTYDADIQIATKLFIESILRFTKESLGEITPVINGADPKDVKEGFATTKELKVKIGQEDGFLRIVDSNTLEVRDNKGDIITVKMPTPVYNNSEGYGYLTEIAISSLILDDNTENKGVSLSNANIPLILDQGLASTYGSYYHNYLYFNKESLNMGHLDPLQVVGTNFFRDIANHMNERSIDPDNEFSTGGRYVEKTSVASLENCTPVSELVNTIATEYHDFRENNHVVTL
jgi:hypothetical protein